MTLPRRLAVPSLAAAALLSDPALAQQLGGGAAPEISLIRVVAALLLCIAVAFAIALSLRHRGRSATWKRLSGLAGAMTVSARVAVIETRRISPHADVCLLRCDGVEYLILCGPSQTQVLSRSPAEAA